MDIAPIDRIETVDATIDADVTAWHNALRAGLEFGRPDSLPGSLREATALLRDVDGPGRVEAYAVRGEDGRVLGGTQLKLPDRDNRHLVRLELAVRPEGRGHGIGRRLLGHAEARAREDGRSSLLIELVLPYDVRDTDWPGARFADRFAYTHRNTELRRVLDHPIDSRVLERLTAHAAEKASAYELRSWVGACPREHAEQYADLKSRLMTEAPMGGLDYERENWDVERLRAFEALSDRQGKTWYTTVAIASDGALAGHTQIVVPAGDLGMAFQADTLVSRAHRGSRLGLALKLENLRSMAKGHPGIERISTWNALDNGPMVAVNEAMGFRVVERMQERQRDLGDPALTKGEQ